MDEREILRELVREWREYVWRIGTTYDDLSGSVLEWFAARAEAYNDAARTLEETLDMLDECNERAA